MESSPYDEAYNIDDDEEPSQVDMYTPSPRNPKQNTRQEKGSKQTCKIDLKMWLEIVTTKKQIVVCYEIVLISVSQFLKV